VGTWVEWSHVLMRGIFFGAWMFFVPRWISSRTRSLGRICDVLCRWPSLVGSSSEWLHHSGFGYSIGHFQL
jgi:hypothetical protein